MVCYASRSRSVSFELYLVACPELICSNFRFFSQSQMLWLNTPSLLCLCWQLCEFFCAMYESDCSANAHYHLLLLTIDSFR